MNNTEIIEIKLYRKVIINNIKKIHKKIYIKGIINGFNWKEK